MDKKIEPSLKLISEYLKSDEQFVIPEYQRSYSWSIPQCDKLWQDIERYMASDEQDPYFFGTIIADCSDSNHISLIDGQQRTTTFILLLKALLIRLNEKLSILDSDDDSRKLKVAIESRRNRILDILYKTNDDTRLDLLEDWSKAERVSHLESRSNNELEEHKRDLKVILDAQDFKQALDSCYKIPRRQKDNRYTNFIRNFKFFYEKLGECDSTRINLFAKTFLSSCQIIEIRSWNTEQAIEMFNSLNSKGMPLSDSDIISAQLFSKAVAKDCKESFNEEWKRIKMISDQLERRKIASIDSLLQQYMYIFRAKNHDSDVTTPGVRRFYMDMKESKHLLEEPMQFCQSIGKIADIWDNFSNVPQIKLLLKFNENAKMFLISFLNRYDSGSIPADAVVRISECLLKLFAVLELVDAGYSSSNFKSFLFKENLKLVDSGVQIDEIERDFSGHILTKWTRENIEKDLVDYDKTILVFLNEYLYDKKHFDFEDTVNIEHIMPASGRNIAAIRRAAGFTDEADFKLLVNCLGNKILLEEDINKSIGNSWFITKKNNSVHAQYDKGYLESSYSLATSLAQYDRDVWTKEDIEKARDKAIKRICDFIFSA